jgi:hypothetical protein
MRGFFVNMKLCRPQKPTPKIYQSLLSRSEKRALRTQSSALLCLFLLTLKRPSICFQAIFLDVRAVNITDLKLF